MNVNLEKLYQALESNKYDEAIEQAQELIEKIEETKSSRTHRTEQMKNFTQAIMRTGYDGTVLNAALAVSREFGFEGTYAPDGYAPSDRRYFDLTPPTNDVGFVRLTIEYINEMPRYADDGTGSEQR